MRRFLSPLVGLLSGAVLACSYPVYPALAQDIRITIESIKVIPTPEGSAIEISADRPFSFVTYTLQNPDRLIVDLTEKGVESLVPERGQTSSDLIKSWQIFWDTPAGELGCVDLISFDLSVPAEHRVEGIPGKLLIRVRPKMGIPSAADKMASDYIDTLLQVPSATGRVSQEYPAIRFPEPFSPLAAVEPAGYSTGELWGLDQALQLGLSRHRQIQVAEEEANFAQMKVKEAHRALFPTAAFKTSWTDGTASRINFREVNHGLQVDHQIYSSGRLRDTYRQALVNLQVAEKRKRKAEVDFTLELTQAYYQLIGAQAALQLQNNLIPQTKEIIEQTKKRFEKGLLTKLEMLNVEAQLNQINFQKATAENDYALAHLKFAQRLKLGDKAVFNIPSEFPSYVPQDISLDESMQLAARYRPDVQINTLLVQFNEYGEQIARSKSNLRVELSTFLGLSGAAFESETLKLGKDYSVGFKATKAWGPHETSFSMTKTKTAPKLGQSSVTNNTVYQGEIGILNQYPAMSEVEQARLGLERARQDLDDTKTSVMQEVEEAYVSYAKARIQLSYAEEKVNFRKEQLKIFRAQADLNEALPSQILAGISGLNDEYIGKMNALTNYYVALARLNKAIGLSGHYK